MVNNNSTGSVSKNSGDESTGLKPHIVDTIPSPEPLSGTPVPPRPVYIRGDFKTSKAIKQYYQDNKIAILKDLAELGLKAMLRRWNIQGGTWRQHKGLAERWGIAVDHKQKKDTSESLSRFDKDKDAIIHDYQTIPLREFLRKWHTSTSTWIKLKELWKVKGKLHGNRYTVASKPPETGVSATRQPIPITKERKSETKPPQSETIAGIRVMVIPIPMSPAALPALPEFDPLWPSDVKMK